MERNKYVFIKFKHVVISADYDKLIQKIPKIESSLIGNKLLFNPEPTILGPPTPYSLTHPEFLGISAKPNFIDIYENTKTPNCFPTKRPNNIPKGTG